MVQRNVASPIKRQRIEHARELGKKWGAINIKKAHAAPRKPRSPGTSRSVAQIGGLNTLYRLDAEFVLDQDLASRPDEKLHFVIYEDGTCETPLIPTQGPGQTFTARQRYDINRKYSASFNGHILGSDAIDRDIISCKRTY